MLLKFVCAAALVLAMATAAPRKRSEERKSALYVEDSDSGQLRFLTGTINQLISPQSRVRVTPIVVSLGGGAAGGTSGTSGTTSPTTGTTGTGAGVGNGALGAAANASPIPGLLPQIVGQAVAGNRRVNKRRRGNRRPNRGRRRRRRPNKPRVIMVRPRQT